MQNSMMLLTIFVFEWRYLFWANLVQKVKIISWIWNLVPRLIRICRIQWWCSLFLLLIRNTLFGQIWSKKLKLSVQGETWYLNKFKYAEFNDAVHFFRFWPETPFLGKFSPNCQYLQVFLFPIRNALFWKNWSKMSKLSV